MDAHQMCLFLGPRCALDVFVFMVWMCTGCTYLMVCMHIICVELVLTLWVRTGCASELANDGLDAHRMRLRSLF